MTKWTLKKFIPSLYHPKLIYPHVGFIFSKKIPLYNFQWKDMTTRRCKATINDYLRPLQCKALHKVLYLNKKLHTFSLLNTRLCSFCKIEEEKIRYLFCYCTHMQDIWYQAQGYFTDCLHFSPLTSKTAIFGFIILIMTLFWFKITYYFYTNYIYTLPKTTDCYRLLTIF